MTIVEGASFSDAGAGILLARDPVSAQQPSQSSNDDHVVGDGPDGDDDDDDDDDDKDACDRSSEYEYTGSAGLDQSQEPSETAVTQQETIVAPESAIDSRTIAHFPVRTLTRTGQALRDRYRLTESC